jgi:SAM-dependent methyltransferase
VTTSEDSAGAETAADMADPLRTDVPHPARMYDYYLGGKTHYPADRAAAERTLAIMPNARTLTVENRAFMRRAARYLAAGAGVRQYLDLGAGIPTSPNLHEIVQEAVPAARVLYVDNDPLVIGHSRVLLRSTQQGRVDYLQADLRDPAAVLGSAELAATLDLSEPVAVCLIAVFHFITNEDDPAGLLAAYLGALPPGSYLVLSQFSADFAPDEAERAAENYRRSGVPAQARSREEITAFFDGLDLVEPGVAVVHRWRADPGPDGPTDAQVGVYGAVARTR